MSASTEPHPPAGTSTFAQVWRRWWGPAPVAAVPAAPPVEIRAASTPFEVPSLGDAYDFIVRGYFNWTGPNLDRVQLTEWSRYWAPSAGNELRKRMNDFAPKYPPHFAQQLEADINRSLKSKVWTYRQNGVVVSCLAQVEVGTDERIRERLQPYWSRRVDLECEHELNMRRAELASLLTVRWTEILAALKQTPLSAQAAKLSSASVAAVLSELGQEESDATAKLTTLLRDASRGHQSMGMYEFATAYDELLRTVERKHGRTVSEPAS